MTKITAWFTGVILVVLGVIVAFIPFGNPLSEYLVTKNAESYLDENYGNTDYYIETVNYDFKTGSYYVHIAAPDSLDKSFTLYAGTDGKISFDTYESSVLEKWNTANRINSEYFEKTRSIMERDDFPYNQHIAFGEIIFKESGVPDGEEIPDYALSTADLVLDGVYDISELGAKAGKLTVYIYDEDISVERLSEILLGIKEFLDDNGVTFYVIDCILEYPRPEDENAAPKEGRTEVMNFLYKDICQEGLTDRVRLSDLKAKEYWETQDALNDKEF